MNEAREHLGKLVNKYNIDTLLYQISESEYIHALSLKEKSASSGQQIEMKVTILSLVIFITILTIIYLFYYFSLRPISLLFLQSKQRLQAVLDSVPVGVLFFDENGVISKDRSDCINKVFPELGMVKNVDHIFDHYSDSSFEKVRENLKLAWNKESSIEYQELFRVIFPAVLEKYDHNGDKISFDLNYKEIIVNEKLDLIAIIMNRKIPVDKSRV